MKFTPCYKCEDRYPGCHSHCEKEAFKEEQVRRYLIKEEKYRISSGKRKTIRWINTPTGHGGDE